jgi:hypothetical protein
LPAIEGHVPREIVRTFRAFLEFCYITRRNVVDTKALTELEDALARFHQYRTAFQELGVRPDGCSLPRQHSLTHYISLIKAFGAPNGLCSSITESKHIKAVKEPWRRSNRYKALGQMLLTNQRLDKLAACRVDFTRRQMLKERGGNPHLDANSPHANPANGEEDDDDGAVDAPFILAHVALSKRHCKWLRFTLFSP